MTADLPSKLVEHWELTFAVGAAVIYCIGYFRAALLLRTLRVDLPPTEIYPSTSLFVSGLTGTIAMLLVPSLVALCAAAIATGLPAAVPYRWAIPIFVLAATFAAMPRLERVTLPGFQIFPMPRYAWRGQLLRCVASVALMAISVAALLTGPGIGVFLLVGLLLWFVSLLWTHIVTAQDISAGIAAGATTHDPVMLGHLVTNGRIAPVGGPVVDFGPDAFQTGGLLLGRRDGVFYFLPGTYALEDLREWPDTWRLVLVPDERVITFLQDPGIDPA